MKAIVLFSGGIDSTVLLSHLLHEKKSCIALSFDYGQKHRQELFSAKQIAAFFQIEHHIITIDTAIFAHSSSSLICPEKTPENFTELTEQTPSTYVPSRNLLFLSHAACFAESIESDTLYFGANKDDCGHYPDCRASFFSSFEKTATLGSSKDLHVICPLQTLSKKQVLEYGKKLQAPLHLTWSCYNPQNSLPCGKCQACMLKMG